MMITMAKKIGRPTSLAAFQRDLPDRSTILAVLLVVLFRLPNHVFGHHDPGIDQHADRDRDAAQRHDVGGDVRTVHEQERPQHGQRQRHGDDENAAEMPEEEDVRQRDQDDLFDQRRPQRIHRMVDQSAAVVERNDVHALGQARLHRCDLRFDGVDDFARIGAVANDDDAADGFLAALVEHAAAEFRPQLHVRHIADVDRRAVVAVEDDVFDVLPSIESGRCRERHLLVADLDDLRADVVVAALDGFDHGAQGNVVGAQFDGIDVDLILAYETADAGHFRHAGHGIELVLDEPVLQRVQRPAVVGPSTVYQNTWPTPVASGPAPVRLPRAESRCQAQALEDTRSGEIDIDVVLEDDVDHREAECRRRAHVLRPPAPAG